MIPANTCGDFVVKRSDGPYAYHLAVVVDDAYSGVNQVVRGADLLSSTPRQILLQEHLDIRRPAYGHLPLVTNPDGSKLSKRANAVSLSAGTNLLREGGRMLLAALIFLGQSPPADIYHVSSADVLAWAAENFDPFTVFRQPAPFPDISELPYVTGATSG
jgi:glutamyl-Q tRNA(Asp) synthetase